MESPGRECLTWSEFQHVSSSWSNRCFLPNCLVFRFSTELTLKAESQRGEVLSTVARARLLPGSPLPHHRFPHFCLPLRDCTPGQGPPPPLPAPIHTPHHPRPGLSPAHCLWTNQRVGHLGSTRPRRTQSWAQSRFESRPPERDSVPASESTRPHL